MSSHRISARPVITDALLDRFKPKVTWDFCSLSGHDPGNAEVGRFRYTFGRDSEWSVALHDLVVKCAVTLPGDWPSLFGPGPNGLVCRNTAICIALEWGSSETARRGLSTSCILRVPPQGRKPALAPLKLDVAFPANTLRGNVALSVQLFVGAPGRPTNVEHHLANMQGFRLGALGPGILLMFEGDGSLFPILEEEGNPGSPLWEFRATWDDPAVDTFSEDNISLVINTRHAGFAELKGSEKANYRTPFFRQVVSTWVSVLLWKLKSEHRDLWAMITTQGQDAFEPRSIALAANYIIHAGRIDTASPDALIRTAQAWMDEALVGKEPR